MAPLFFALVALAAAPPPDAPCAAAREAYQALSFVDALAAARAGRPELECLEVEALVLLALGRNEEMREVLTALFEREPEHVIEDPSLSPTMRESIDRLRESVRPISAEVAARWIVHESLRLDVVLSGGLRGAERIRYDAVVGPVERRYAGEVRLVGRAATATVSVEPALDAGRLALSGRVFDRTGRVVHAFSSELLLPERPAPTGVERVVVQSDGVPWFVWAAVGAVAVGAAVTVAVVVQPDLPDARGGVGRAEVSP